MKFSERKGFKPSLKIVQKDAVNDELRNSIWNILYSLRWRRENFLPEKISTVVNIHEEFAKRFDITSFSKNMWQYYLKKPVDTRPGTLSKTFNAIRNYFFECQWFEFYDFLEFILNYYVDEKLNNSINETLEKEVSAYRFVNKQITEITDKQEIEMLENALTDEDFPNVKVHLQRALELLSDRKSPDYRNSIKESISAVESIAKEIAQKPKAELGDALKEIENQGKIHGAMKKAFLNLYGYTSDANGIRHALMEESNLTADDAKFFLLSCTSFTNYLKAKM